MGCGVVAEAGIEEVRRHRPDLGVIVVTHYQRILDDLTPDHVHVLVDGGIVESGGPELAEAASSAEGYEAWRCA